jgi:hypothetical protein
MATIMSIKGIFPSNSGNTRVMVTFKQRGDLHFYMKPDGTLHIPSKHDPNTLNDPYEGYKEWEWVYKTWKKTNNQVVCDELSGELRSLAMALAKKLISPERKEVMRLAMIAKSGNVPLGQNGDLKKKLNGLKKEIRKENKNKTPDPAPEAKKVHSPVPIVKKNGSPVQPSIYGTSQVDKFYQRYQRAK